MENPITIREAFTENDAAAFWEQLHMYFKRDIFPDPNDRNREYFLSDSEYRAHVQKIHDRPEDRVLLSVLSSEWTGHRLCHAGYLHL